jgi:hypothetical protein
MRQVDAFPKVDRGAGTGAKARLEESATWHRVDSSSVWQGHTFGDGICAQSSRFRLLIRWKSFAAMFSWFDTVF